MLTEEKVIQLEQQLKKLMMENSLSEAKHLSDTILESSPNNKLAHQSLIQYFFRYKSFDKCIEKCSTLLAINPKDKLAAKYLILSLVESKDLVSAKNKVKSYIAVCGIDEEVLLLKAEVAVCMQNFEEALIAYKELHNFSPEFFSIETLKTRKNNKQHFNNVTNLLKRNAYMQMQTCMGVSRRLDSAINCFFGLEKAVQSHKLQKGSFFNIPNLTAKPYYQVDEISGLKSLVEKILLCMPLLKSIIKDTDRENYIDAIGAKNMQKEWLLLAKKWQSIHLLKADKQCEISPEIEQVKKVFQDTLVADCPPHAPEAFISILPADTIIPPHHGLSNVKLTVHVPIYVDELSSLTVGGERKTWIDEDIIIFDDSFLHSADNRSSNSRAVLIFDIWHPDLTLQERGAIKTFMQTHDTWSQEYAQLSKAVKVV
ncbi:aspartyl/asparaginyl beta-hydroxylase domain-containing protein [Colwellia sp. BRX10-3]|uniref:aspartyl/asparaginyl beta-hydroxylase domain-containing protein n=1 Tax=Colwellia sp. BRX10-3 TaxID=2759844 RepID=UPI0015F3A591|nr:aspartyl/asparaginyl beta-hydroxylase domain-containing protein [Colwellia sp. BRX10-3]MBA6389208.1 aspartyl/asparaginyl beta-hydroxylase domain-containing protein [Colwellia sp. BRX10-3]